MTGVGAALAQALPVVVHADADARQWDRYVSGHPEASGYHPYAWRDVISRTFGHDTRYLTAESAAGVVGVLPLVIFRSRMFGRFIVSMPFLNYGGVLATTAAAETALLEAAVNEASRAGAAHLELRHSRQIFSGLQAKRHKVAMVVPLQGSADDLWLRLDRKVRNQVRKAEKSGLRMEQGAADLVAAFYEVFARNMRDLGTPVYSIRWFQEILAAFPATTRIFVVYSGDQPVAASFVYWHGSTLEVPWASSLREFNPQCPNVYLYWEMLRFAAERGFGRFDLGRSTPDEGTFHFKRQWGAEPRELVWEYWMSAGRSLPDLSPKNPRFNRAIAAWRRLPVGVTNVIGPRIARSIP
jgi:FemAB-related protein (PEP-CTERM system-associated)